MLVIQSLYWSIFKYLVSPHALIECNAMISSNIVAMHRVGSAGNTTNSVRPRKEKRLTYVLSDADDTKVK